MIAARPYLVIHTSEEALALTRALKSIGCIDFPSPYAGTWFLNSAGSIVRASAKPYLFARLAGYPPVQTNSIPHFIASVRRWNKVPRP